MAGNRRSARPGSRGSSNHHRGRETRTGEGQILVSGGVRTAALDGNPARKALHLRHNRLLRDEPRAAHPSHERCPGASAQVGARPCARSGYSPPTAIGKRPARGPNRGMSMADPVWRTRDRPVCLSHRRWMWLGVRACWASEAILDVGRGGPHCPYHPCKELCEPVRRFSVSGAVSGSSPGPLLPHSHSTSSLSPNSLSEALVSSILWFEIPSGSLTRTLTRRFRPSPEENFERTFE